MAATFPLCFSSGLWGMPWCFLPAQLPVMWGLKGVRVETGDIIGIQLRRREIITAARVLRMKCWYM